MKEIKTYRLKIHTGPTRVKQFSRVAKRAGLKVVSTGTEHLLIDVKGSNCDNAESKMRNALTKKHRKDFSFRARTCDLRK